MSSWFDWEKALIPQHNGRKAKVRTQCKLGRHVLLEGVAAAWLRDPMGLSCVPCIREAGLEVPPDPNPPVAARVPNPRTRKRTRVAASPDSGASPGPGPEWSPPADWTPPKSWTEDDSDAWRTDPTHWRHGKKWTYDHHRCRCQPCITASTVAGSERRKRQRARRRAAAA